MNLEKYIQLSGPLFEAVQTKGIFKDGKTFVDSIPISDPQEILQTFEEEKDSPTFDLKLFVERHFTFPKEKKQQVPKSSSMKEYIFLMWDLLLKEMQAPSPYSTLISLPKPHIVPGGRFQECFYWDSYFTALGLLADKRIPLIKDMVENFAFLIDTFGYIPNGNRVYFASRSQPPYFSFLLSLLYDAGEKEFALKYTHHLEKEYHYWIEIGERYFDSQSIPRPEAFKREMELAKTATSRHFFQNLRAACASGWDFSSRWLKDQKSFETIHTLDLLPVDLHSLLFHCEEILFLFSEKAQYKQAAEKRKKRIQTLFWNEDFFFDYHLPSKSHTKVYSLAATTPLFVKAATKKQAEAVAQRIEKDFLLDGGFVTSLTEGIHQWDSPNGWAPLQWITIQGLLNYGYWDLALEGAKRWLTLNEKIFHEKGTLLEKYNVRECSAEVARGEYALQEGFGWTNGVARALMSHHPEW